MPTINPDLLSILRCPVSGAPLVQEDDSLVSTDEETRLAYPILDEKIPVLLREEGKALNLETWKALMKRHISK